MSRSVLVLAQVLGISGCEQTARDAKDKAAEATDKALESGKNKAGQLADKGKQAAADKTAELTEAGKRKTKAWIEDLTDTGELSASAKAWLKQGAAGAGTTVESVIVSGVQVAPAALEIAKILDDVVDSETAVEPIFQKLDKAGDQEKVDAAIGDMPRVEVVDGVKVGFRRLDALDTSKQRKERAYLVTWRRDDHLVGFVYRSTRTVDLDELAAQTPRLVKLTNEAIAKL